MFQLSAAFETKEPTLISVKSQRLMISQSSARVVLLNVDKAEVTDAAVSSCELDWSCNVQDDLLSSRGFL